MGTINVKEPTTVDTPSSGYSALYPKSDGSWYHKNSVGVETQLAEAASALSDKVFFVSKTGNDSNTGQGDQEAFLTFGAAITACIAESPTINNPWGIKCEDAGIYTENLTIPSNVNIEAPLATFVSNLVLNDFSSLHINVLSVTSNIGISKTSGSGTGGVRCNVFTIAGTSTGMLCTSGAIDASVGTAANASTGDLIGGGSTGNIDYWGNSIALASTGAAINLSGSGKIVATLNRVEGGATGIVVSSTGDVHAHIAELNCTIPWNVGASGELTLVSSEIYNKGSAVSTGTVEFIDGAHGTDTTNPHSTTATHVGLGNVDNESKATMFTDPTFTGTHKIDIASATTDYVLTATDADGTATWQPVAASSVTLEAGAGSESVITQNVSGVADAVAGGIKALAIGGECVANGNYTIALGFAADAGSAASTVLIGGSNAVPLGQSVIIGYSATSKQESVAIGWAANTTGNYGTAVGSQATAAASGTAIGKEAEALTGSIVIGAGATAAAGSVSVGSVGVSSNAAALGTGSKALLSYCTAMGASARTGGTGVGGTAFGYDTVADVAYATAIGYAANALHTNSVALGKSATTTATSQIRLGTAAETVSVAGDLEVDGDVTCLSDVKIGTITNNGGFDVTINATSNGNGIMVGNGESLDTSANRRVLMCSQSTGGEGYFYDVAGQLQVALRGGDNLDSYFNTGGNLGINTPTPSVALDVVGDAIISGDLIVGDGTAALPSIHFASDTDTGWSYEGIGGIQFSSGGIKIFQLDNQGLRAKVNYGAEVHTTVASSATVPVFRFRSDTDTGIGRAAADELSLITGGTEAVRIDATQNATFTANVDVTGQILAQDEIVMDSDPTGGIKLDTTTPAYGWHDLVSPFTASPSVQNKPTLEAYRGGAVNQYKFDVDDEGEVSFHMPHDYVEGTDIFIHAHWSCNVAPSSGGVIWDFAMTYAKGHDQALFGAEVVPTVSQTASTTQYQHMIAEVQCSAASPSATQLDSDDLETDGLILVNVSLNTNTMDNGAKPFLHFVDIHYQSHGLPTKNKAPNFYT